MRVSQLRQDGKLSYLVRRLKRRPDSEHIQALIRVVITALVALYLNSGFGGGNGSTIWGDRLALGYALISPVFLIWIIIQPASSHPRRYLAMVMELSLLSACLVFEGERGAPLTPVYVWVSLGNGFRYGVKQMLWSTFLSGIGFTCVVAFSAFWQTNLPVAIGIGISMIAIPAYAASLIKQLHASRLEAEQASFSKSRFLATASHELRTPLHAIIGLSELLQQTTLNSEQLEMVRTVRGSGRALLSLVEDVLDLSSIQAGRIAYKTQAFDLHEAVAETVAIVRPQASSKGLDLAVRISPDIPASLSGDWPHMRQILMNLMTNAIKFTEKGQVSLTVESIGIYPDEVRLAFAVSDTGIGIAQNDKDRIFETFGQLNTSSTRKYGGVGLGLAIVRQLADLLHGSVSVASTPGKGSVFTVELPFTRDSVVAKALPPLVLAVQTTDAALLPVLRNILPGIEIVEVVPIHAKTTVVTLLDARQGMEDIDALSRRIVAEQQGAAAAMIAVGITAGSIDGMAPAIVSCLTNLDPATLEPALRIAICLAVHRDIVTALQGEKDLTTIAPFKPDGTVLANGIRILVVEDSAVNRMVTQKILHSAGYCVILADSADTGLELLAEEEFDLILMDLNMPGTNGVDIIKLYKVMRLGQSMPPIVIFSADVTEESRAECEELGVSLFLPKPSEPSFILQQLASLAPRPELPSMQMEALPEPANTTPIVEISSHPRYRPTQELGIVDRHALQSLASLDSGLTFLNELIAEFEKDTVGLLDLIDRSVRDRNMPLFWDQIHAIRSSAANVGAKQILTACTEINAEGKMSFHKRGFEYAARLRYEFNRFQRTMDRFLIAQAKPR